MDLKLLTRNLDVKVYLTIPGWAISRDKKTHRIKAQGFHHAFHIRRRFDSDWKRDQDYFR